MGFIKSTLVFILFTIGIFASAFVLAAETQDPTMFDKPPAPVVILEPYAGINLGGSGGGVQPPSPGRSQGSESLLRWKKSTGPFGGFDGLSLYLNSEIGILEENIKGEVCSAETEKKKQSDFVKAVDDYIKEAFAPYDYSCFYKYRDIQFGLLFALFDVRQFIQGLINFACATVDKHVNNLVSKIQEKILAETGLKVSILFDGNEEDVGFNSSTVLTVSKTNRFGGGQGRSPLEDVINKAKDAAPNIFN